MEMKRRLESKLFTQAGKLNSIHGYGDILDRDGLAGRRGNSNDPTGFV